MDLNNKAYFLSFFLFFTAFQFMQAQDDLLDLLGEEAEETEYVKASFKTTRVINAQSLENVAGGVLDFKINHRFGMLNSGARELFGLDAANVRIGLDYGITDWLMIGIGRSSQSKVYETFVKAKILRQSTGKKNMPLSVIWYSSLGLHDREVSEERKDLGFEMKHRMAYTHQLIIGSRLSKATSIEILPTFVHKNLVPKSSENNQIFLLGIAGRQKINKRIALNIEYFYLLPDQVSDDIKQSLSLGLDIETGGHVFQLHFTNSTGLPDTGFLTETTGDWLDGDIHFGFNISRVFTIVKPNRKKKGV